MTESKNRRTTPSSSGASPRERLLGAALALLGLALAGTGVAAVFTTDSDTGAAALLGVGIILVLFVAIGERLELLRYGDLELVLRRKADEAAKRGDHDAANALRHAADTVSGRVERAAHTYKAVRRMKPGHRRTDRLDEIVEEGRQAAHEREIDEEEVLRVVWTGSAGARAWALGVLEERPEFATTRAILEALERPEHVHDQYHALVLADRFLALDTTERWASNRIADKVRHLRASGAFGTDADCLNASAELLQHADELRDRRS